MSLRRVTASVLLALDHGLSDDDVAHVLMPHALQWEPERRSVVDVGILRMRLDG